jgi:hypothetical protein
VPTATDAACALAWRLVVTPEKTLAAWDLVNLSSRACLAQVERLPSGAYAVQVRGCDVGREPNLRYAMAAAENELGKWLDFELVACWPEEVVGVG